MPRRVTFEARAKLNLGLAVGPKRADGYHDLVTVFQSISLADTLTAERTARGFSLRVQHEPAAIHGAAVADRARVPAGADNLVLRAARLMHAELGLPGGAHFTLTKRIPAQAGMGGGEHRQYEFNAVAEQHCDPVAALQRRRLDHAPVAQ